MPAVDTHHVPLLSDDDDPSLLTQDEPSSCVSRDGSPSNKRRCCGWGWCCLLLVGAGVFIVVVTTKTVLQQAAQAGSRGGAHSHVAAPANAPLDTPVAAAAREWVRKSTGRREIDEVRKFFDPSVPRGSEGKPDELEFNPVDSDKDKLPFSITLKNIGNFIYLHKVGNYAPLEPSGFSYFDIVPKTLATGEISLALEKLFVEELRDHLGSNANSLRGKHLLNILTAVADSFGFQITLDDVSEKWDRKTGVCLQCGYYPPFGFRYGRPIDVPEGLVVTTETDPEGKEIYTYDYRAAKEESFEGPPPRKGSRNMVRQPGAKPVKVITSRVPVPSVGRP